MRDATSDGAPGDRYAGCRLLTTKSIMPGLGVVLGPSWICLYKAYSLSMVAWSGLLLRPSSDALARSNSALAVAGTAQQNQRVDAARQAGKAVTREVARLSIAGGLWIARAPTRGCV